MNLLFYLVSPTIYIMLDYCKIILEKMSFDRALFTKELKKALSYLSEKERIDFKNWCYKKFSHQYDSLLTRVFKREWQPI
jgi:hypothetical protein